MTASQNPVCMSVHTCTCRMSRPSPATWFDHPSNIRRADYETSQWAVFISALLLLPVRPKYLFAASTAYVITCYMTPVYLPRFYHCYYISPPCYKYDWPHSVILASFLHPLSLIKIQSSALRPQTILCSFLEVLVVAVLVVVVVVVVVVVNISEGFLEGP